MDHEEHDYVNDEPEYDMEFSSYGPNTFDIPLSPPRTPPPAPEHPQFTREMSPFSEATSMTSVDSTESVGQSSFTRAFYACHSDFTQATIEKRVEGCSLRWYV